jgi:hypothetical protein
VGSGQVNDGCTSLVQVKMGQKWLDMLACLQAVTGEGMGSLIEEALRNSGPWWYRWLRGAIEGGEIPEELDLTPVLAVLGRENRRGLERLREKVQRKGVPGAVRAR